MKNKQEELTTLGNLLLEIGALLMSSGASTGRIRVTINRIAEAKGYQCDLLITHRALMLTLGDTDHPSFFSSLKRTSPHGVNFKLVSGISRMSWRVVQEKWNVEKISEDLERLKALPHFSRWIILTFVALAGSSFCRLFGGEAIEMIVTFVATFIGLFVRQEAHKRQFNPYLCVLFAATTSSMIAGAAMHYNIGAEPEHAFATSVLYLIPGVPFINSFTDLIDGNILNGVVRGVHGLIISFAIALGLVVAKLIFNI